MRFLGLMALACVAGCSGCGTKPNREASDESVELWRMKQENELLKKLRNVSFKIAISDPDWRNFEQGKWERVQVAYERQVSDKEQAMKTKFGSNFVEIVDFSKDRERKRIEVEKKNTAIDDLIEILKSRIATVVMDYDGTEQKKKDIMAKMDKEFDWAHQNAMPIFAGYEKVIKEVNP